jgi:putative transposase
MVTYNPAVLSAIRRTFTEEEKLEILQQARQAGIIKILRKHNLSYSVFSRWKQQFTERDISPDRIQAMGTEMKLLKEENTRLKKIIADQALSLELKNEELRRLCSVHEKK